MNSAIKLRVDKTEEPVSVSSRRCGICFEAMSKYTCPRCNLSYCSVECFKNQKHSGCSESFYKDWFIEEMKQSRASDEEKLKIMKMLKNFEEENNQEDEFDETTLEERLRNVDLDDSDNVWSRLTQEEKEEFHQRLCSGSLISEWKPWWLHHDTSLIKEIDELSSMSETTRVPQHDLQVPELSTLLRGKQPSPQIRNNLIEVLYSYAYFCRKYNGNTKDFACELAQDVMLASLFLKKGRTPSTCAEAIQGAIDGCISLAEDYTSKTPSVGAILDVHHILMGRDKDTVSVYTEAAIKELHFCCGLLQKEAKRRKSEVLNRKEIFRVVKKLEFLLSWTLNCKSELVSLAVEVIKIYKDKVHFEKEHKRNENIVHKAKQSVKFREKSQPLIQELY